MQKLFRALSTLLVADVLGLGAPPDDPASGPASGPGSNPGSGPGSVRNVTLRTLNVCSVTPLTRLGPRAG
jgi:hypothetical protein